MNVRRLSNLLVFVAVFCFSLNTYQEYEIIAQEPDLVHLVYM